MTTFIFVELFVAIISTKAHSHVHYINNQLYT